MSGIIETERSIIVVKDSNGNTVSASEYIVDNDKPFREALSIYIKKKGVEEAKKEFNGILEGWETKPIKELIAETIKKKIPVSYIHNDQRIFREATVKLWRSVFGQAVRKVLAGRV